MALANERVAWFNGKAFRLEDHVARLYRSLKYLDLDPGLLPAEMISISANVLELNRHLLAPDEDYWLAQRVSRGIHRVPGDNWGHYGPNVIVECVPLPLRERARHFKDGIDLITPSLRRTPPDSLSPRAKMHQYLNLILADREVKAQNPAAWAVLLDVNGNLSEGQGSNVFLVRDGRLLTPKEKYVLPGVSRQAAIDLARQHEIPFEERDIDLYDAYTADECFLTSTSLCICGVRSINGRTFAVGKIPGPITQRLIEAYKQLVDCDFVAQYLQKLDG